MFQNLVTLPIRKGMPGVAGPCPNLYSGIIKIGLIDLWIESTTVTNTLLVGLDLFQTKNTILKQHILTLSQCNRSSMIRMNIPQIHVSNYFAYLDLIIFLFMYLTLNDRTSYDK